MEQKHIYIKEIVILIVHKQLIKTMSIILVNHVTYNVEIVILIVHIVHNVNFKEDINHFYSTIHVTIIVQMATNHNT